MKKIIFLVIDIIICVVVTPIFLLYGMFLFLRRNRNSYKSYLVLIDSANINSIYKKFKSLNIIKTLHYNDLFKKHFVIYHKTSNEVDLSIDDGFIIMERKFYRLFSVYSHYKNIIFMVKVVFENDISLLRATSPYEMGLKGWLVSKITRVPFCVSLHTDTDNRERFDGNAKPKILNSSVLTGGIETFVFSHTQFILPIRESMIDYVVKHGGTRDKCYVIPHGLDLSFFEKRHVAEEKEFKKKYSISKKIVSFVGRLEKQNYTDDIIKISELLLNKNKNIVVFIAGDGAEKDRFLDFQRKYRDNSIVAGSISQQDVYVLRESSYINLALMGGYSLIEACASANPVISYDVEWHYELIKNNETGFLVKENDIEGVVEKITYLLDNPDEKNRLGENSKKIVFKKHSLEGTNTIKTEIYNKIIGIYNDNP